MSAFATLWVAIGLADLLGTRDWRGSRLLPGPLTGRFLGLLAGLAAIGVLAPLGGLTGWGDLVLLGMAAVTTGAWVVLAGRAQDTDRHQGWALGVLTAGAALLVVCGGWASPVGGPLADWLAWTGVPHLTTIDPTLALLLVGLFLVQLATGNIVVRLVLAQVGALNPLGDPGIGQRLKGGRILGPLERVFILGLGLAGQVTAASLVIAAKGLIRWPELQQAGRDAARSRHAVPRAPHRPGGPEVGIDQITEYFLIGSFVSWLVALGSLVLAQLAG